jgi:hypothetical protein
MCCAKHLISWKFGSITLKDLNFINIYTNHNSLRQYTKIPGLFSNMPVFFSGTRTDVYFIKKKWERRKISLHDATMENPQRNTRTT